MHINRKTINSRRWRKEGYDPRGDGKTRNTFGNQYGLLSIKICDLKFSSTVCVGVFISECLDTYVPKSYEKYLVKTTKVI